MRAFAVPVARVLVNARDAWLLGAVSIHVGLMILMPTPVVIGVLFWWTANTVAHNFIHTPFFRDRRANAAFSSGLTLLLGVPQALWRARHLAHHAGCDADLRSAPGLRRETLLVCAWWCALVVIVPDAVLFAYAPGLLIGLALSWLQGHYEHARGVTSHRGRLYNALFFNDGYHAEHHARPGRHWSELPFAPSPGERRSRYPAVARFLETHPLDALERVALRSAFVRERLLAVHERALRELLPALPPIHRVVIVGGGLFPRSAIILRRLLPNAQLAIVDAEAESLAAAAPLLPRGVRTIHARFDPAEHVADLVVLPLAFVGDRDALAADPTIAALVIHDWIWVRRGLSAPVAWWLLKRMNAIVRDAAE